MADPKLIAAMEKYQVSRGSRTVEVPEWETTFHVTPLTLKEQSLLHGWSSRGKDDQLLIYARIIVMKAQNAAGERVYQDKDYSMLVDLDYDLLSRVALEMTQEPSDSELKN